MNLSEYSRMAKNAGQGEFLKWTRNGEVKVLRFLYTSNDGADIEVRRKEWDETQKKYVYDTPGGKLTCVLNCVIYENGQSPKRVRWERSASFTEQACNGYWSKFPRIIDGVWEVTCTNPGTKDIKFSWFPIQGADFTTYPLPEGVSLNGNLVVYSDSTNNGQAEISQEPGTLSTATPTAAPTDQIQSGTSFKKYWE